MIDRRAVLDETKADKQHADVTEFARMHYGADWISQLATDLSMRPDELIQIFASRAPFDAGFVTKVGTLMDVYLSELEVKLQETLAFTAQIRGTAKAVRSSKLPKSIERRFDEIALRRQIGRQKRREKSEQAI